MKTNHVWPYTYYAGLVMLQCMSDFFHFYIQWLAPLTAEFIYFGTRGKKKCGQFLPKVPYSNDTIISNYLRFLSEDVRGSVFHSEAYITMY